MKTFYAVLYQDETVIGIHKEIYDTVEEADERVELFKEQDKEDGEHYYYKIFAVEAK